MDSKRPARLPRTLLEAVRYFADADPCREFMMELRWPNGISCPTCGRTDVRFIATRNLWECKTKHPRKQFSIKVGTIFEDSPLGMEKWLPVVWLIANCKNGISSYEAARDLGVTQIAAVDVDARDGPTVAIDIKRPNPRLASESQKRRREASRVGGCG